MSRAKFLMVEVLDSYGGDLFSRNNPARGLWCVKEITQINRQPLKFNGLTPLVMKITRNIPTVALLYFIMMCMCGRKP